MPYHKENDGHISKPIKRGKRMDVNTAQLRNPLSDEIEDLKLSLRDKTIQDKIRKTLNLANSVKEQTRCFLRELREELKQVLARNKLLPKPLQFSDDYFQLDERINNSIMEEEQSKMDKLHLKLAFDYEKNLLGLKNIKNYMVDKIITDKFEVKAILYGLFLVYGFFLKIFCCYI